MNGDNYTTIDFRHDFEFLVSGNSCYILNQMIIKICRQLL